MHILSRVILTITLLLALCLTANANQSKPQALITIDDFPFSRDSGLSDLEKYNSMNRIFDGLGLYVGHTIFFVNSQYLTPETEEKLEWIVSQGGRLGNHTSSHARMSSFRLRSVQEQILMADKVITRYDKKSPKFFRSPYLDLGEPSMTDEFNYQFLQENNYRIIPVSFDSQDWLHERLYVDLLLQGRTIEAHVVRKDFLHEFYDRLKSSARSHTKLNIPAIMLFHVSHIVAHSIHELMVMIRSEFHIAPIDDVLNHNLWQLSGKQQYFQLPEVE